MGGGYSDLNIYLLSKKSEPKTSEYNVTFTKKNFEGCSSFVVFTHTINFSPSNKGLSYNIILYDGYNVNKKGEYVFGYYYPGNENEVIKSVSTYYSVLAPKVPLVVSFNSGNIYNCYFSNLKNARWDYAYNIDIYSFRDSLNKDLLDKEFKKRSRNRKIKFTTNNDNKDVIGYPQEIGEDKRMFRFIFIPEGDESVLGLKCIFEIDVLKKKPKLSQDLTNRKVQIDPYYLPFVNGRFFDGIIVYFARDKPRYSRKEDDYKGTALLIEFYDSTKDKISLKRNDKEGAWWSQVVVDCNEDKKLLETLKDIDNKVKNDQSVIVILDQKINYLGATVKPEVDSKACKKYTHQFTKKNNPVFLFAREIKQIVNLDNFKADTVEVYYLKVKDVEDDEPFVIVIYSSDDRIPKTKKAFHFTDKNGFQDWKEFNYEFKEFKVEGVGIDMVKEVKNKLYDKLKKINDSGSCIDNLGLLRWYAYRILISQDPTEKEIKEKADVLRPKVNPPKEKPDGLPIPWIIAGSVGGGVFVISSAALYGVYWYNTTIKLLT